MTSTISSTTTSRSATIRQGSWATLSAASLYLSLVFMQRGLQQSLAFLPPSLTISLLRCRCHHPSVTPNSAIVAPILSSSYTSICSPRGLRECCVHTPIYATDSNVMASHSTLTHQAKRTKIDGAIVGDNDDKLEEEDCSEGEMLNDEEAGEIIEAYPPGIPSKTFSIIQHATIPPGGFAQSLIDRSFSKDEIERLKLEPDNVTVPVGLMLLFPEEFPTLTNARKQCRRKKILIHRGSPVDGVNDGGGRIDKKLQFDPERLSIGKVGGDRVNPGDTICIQTRMSHNYSECKNHNPEPPFHLPVAFEDDYFALVNKPENIVVFSHKNGGFGRESVNSCLPWVLTPPRAGVVSVMRRPSPCHRIDRGTSGLLVCAKTKPAMIELTKAFRERRVKKTYTAIVNGDILEPKERSITSQQAKGLGVCIEDENNSDLKDTSWQMIDDDIEDQSAVTIWKPLRKWSLDNARNNTVSLVELKPKTGRYHQLRRHMAWVCNCPLLGDKKYDGGGLAREFRDEGFYLCSNRVTLEHPYYNTPAGRKEWETKKKVILREIKNGSNDCGKVRITEENDGTVLVHCEIDLPSKFSDV